ncbi:MAG: glycosyltransferase family 39 protein [Candidatus Moraniibacteriota bacterium]
MKDFLKRHSFSLVLLLGFVLRIVDLTKRDFWFDEAFTGISIKENLSEMFRIIIADIHPPLYYLAVKAFAAPFGYSVFGIRFFSLIFGILGIWMVYLLAKDFFGKKAALLAALLTAISPFAIQYSQEGRMYSMFAFFIVLSAFLFLRALRKNSFSSALGWGLCWGLACLTHYLGILFAPVYYGLYLLEKVRTRKEIFSKIILPPSHLWWGGAVALLVFSPWLPNFVHHVGASNLTWITPAKISDLFFNLQIFLVGIPKGKYGGMPVPNDVYAFDSMTLFVLLVYAFSFIAYYLFRKMERKLLYQILTLGLGFMFVLYVLSLLGKHFLVARYILPSAYFVFILLGGWLALLKPRTTILIVAAYTLLILGIQPVPMNQGYGELARDIGSYGNANFYALNSFDYILAKYYLGPERVVLYNIDWPTYDSSGWAAIGSEKLKMTDSFDHLKNDSRGYILYNTEVEWTERSDKSFGPEKFDLVKKYNNLEVYRSNPHTFFR